MTLNSFGSRSALSVGGTAYEIHRLDALSRAGVGHVDRLPFSMKVLLENLLRREDGRAVSDENVRAVASWTGTRAAPGESEEREIAFMPARVLLQPFTGVPAVVDLAAMRDAMRELGGDAKRGVTLPGSSSRPREWRRTSHPARGLRRSAR